MHEDLMLSTVNENHIKENVHSNNSSFHGNIIAIKHDFF